MNGEPREEHERDYRKLAAEAGLASLSVAGLWYVIHERLHHRLPDEVASELHEPIFPSDKSTDPGAES